MPWENDTVSSGSYMKPMTFDEILHFSQGNFQIPLAKNDLFPDVNADRIIALFAALMQHIKADFDVLVKQSPFFALTSIDRLEDFDSYLSLRNLFCIIKDFLRTVGYNDFIFNDVLAPKSMRTRTILSQLMSFLLFSDSRFDKTKCLEEKLVSLEGKRDELARLEPSLQRELTDSNAELARTEIRFKQLYHDFNISKMKLEEVIEKQALVQTLRDDTKNNIANLKEEKEKVSNGVGELRLEAMQLDSLIALEPDKLGNVIVSRQTEVSDSKLQIHTQKSRLVFLSARKTTICSWIFRMNKIVEVISAIYQQLKVVSSLEEQYSNLTHKGKNSRNEISDLQANLEDLRRQFSACDEKWNCLEQQHEAKFKAKKFLLRDMKKNKKWLTRTVNEKDVVMGSLYEDMKEKYAYQQKLQKDLTELEADYPVDFFHLMKSMDNFHLKLYESLQVYRDAIDTIGIIKVY